MILVFVIPFLLYKIKVDNIALDCNLNVHSGQVTRGEGFVIVENMLSETCRQRLVDKFLVKAKENKNLNEDVKLEFYTNDFFFETIVPHRR